MAVATKRIPATFRGWLHETGNEGLFKLVVGRASGVLVGALDPGATAFLD